MCVFIVYHCYIKPQKRAMSSVYNHPRPYLAVDCVAICFVPSSKTESMGSLRLLLTYKDDLKKWTLPGRFLISAERAKRDGCKEKDEYGSRAETIPQTFRRALSMEEKDDNGDKRTIYLSKYYNTYDITGKMLDEGERSPSNFQPDEFIIQLPIMSGIRRDEDRVKIIKHNNGKAKKTHPYYRVISAPFLTMLRPDMVEPPTTHENRISQWIPLQWILTDNNNRNEIKKVIKCPQNKGILKPLPRNPELFEEHYDLPFDHPEILANAIWAMRRVIKSQPIGIQLLANKFKLSDLNTIYNEIVGYTIDATSFRKSMMERRPRQSNDEKKITNENLIQPTDEIDKNTARSIAKLVKFNTDIYNAYTENLNFNFTL